MVLSVAQTGSLLSQISELDAEAFPTLHSGKGSFNESSIVASTLGFEGNPYNTEGTRRRTPRMTSSTATPPGSRRRERLGG